MSWIRNEWLLADDGSWSQGGLCVKNYPESVASVEQIIRSWRGHQWLRVGDDLIIGIPDPIPNQWYLVVFSKTT